MYNIEVIIGIVTGVAVASSATLGVIGEFRKREQLRKKLETAEKSARETPEKAKPAWDLARVTLEAYFNRNLTQVSAIFWLCAFVMVLGFGAMVWGIAQAVRFPDTIAPALLTAASGVLTELIGATFLFVYRATMAQAEHYTKTLERINAVGMAMQILDTLNDEANKADSLKDQTKAAVVRALMRESIPTEPAGDDGRAS
jgi:sterol desaturase/sphingolipid hydroxylase (fatty acid hydroxylase superfamily)